MSEGYNIGKLIRREFFFRELRSPAGIVFLILIAIGVSFLAFTENYLAIGGIIAVFAGSLLLNLCIFHPLTGFYVVTLIAVFAFYPGHIIHVELGFSTLVEILTWILLLGSLRQNSPNGIKNNLWASPITIVLVIYTLYNLMQFFNPELNFRSMYYFTVRKLLMFLWIYIIAYRLINTPEKFKFFLKFWILIAFLAAAYGCYQQWFGYLPQELQWIKNDPINYALIFQGGQFRKFSFFPGVAQFGIFSGSFCVLTLIVAIHEKRKKHKIFLFFAAILMALGMSYSGTRTATLILPLGISLYVLMTIRNKTTLVTIFGTLMLFLFIFFAPIHSNKTLNRLRTSFESDDPSLNFRVENRHFIQPYLHAHPFGGGIGTTGLSGYALDPSHYLAGFPPDSGLLKLGLETGWIGLVLTMIWYLSIFYFFIYTAFRIRSPEFKIYTIAMVCCLLGIIFAQYSQTSIGQIPMVIFYMSSISVVKRLLEFERLNLYKQ